MNKGLVPISIILFFSIVLISCTNQNSSNTDGKETVQSGASGYQGNFSNKSDPQTDATAGKTNKLTIEEIKAKYTGGEAGKIVYMTTYKSQYILVEYSIDGTSGHFFDWYNLKTGDRDALPTYAYHVKLNKIVDENHIRFIYDGTNNVNNHRYFPEIIECYRGQEITGYEGDFYQVKHKYYLPVDQGFNMGNKPNETIADIKVSLEGLEVLFEPMQGEEGGFYAAYTTVPPTKTSYDKTKNLFFIEFENTDIDSKLDLSKISEQNRYLNSVNIKRNGLNTTLEVNLKDTAKYYTIYFSHLEPMYTIDDFPYLDFNFANAYEIDTVQ